MRLLAVIVLTLILLPLAAACGERGSGSLLDEDTLVVGVRPDLPGIGLRRPDGSFEGYDVDVARYVAGRLGKDVRFVPALAADRIPLLRSGKADAVFAMLSVTPDRKTQVAFAGPYHLSFQDVLVRADEKAAGVRDLKGRRFCSVRGTNTRDRLLAVHGMAATIVEAASYDECMAKIRAGAIDAITTNDVILAGLMRREGGGYRLINAKFSEQGTAIGIRHGDPDGCEALNRAVTRMYQDGTAATLIRKWFGGTGLESSTIEVPQFEGCD
ncbi:transporter substrate-binding domain-containing protein [Spirillospora albida]|uniref:transporter substrate-binding domain-containing protein n=1 Tax=Spirillospora albida TaxID=58123 RepID=UPI0004C08EFB|nr:transporter substrate-binding domain-containing protein [Spirillospora albida]